MILSSDKTYGQDQDDLMTFPQHLQTDHVKSQAHVPHLRFGCRFELLSPKAEFIAPSSTLSHRFFGCLSHLEVLTLPAFLVGFVLGLWVLFGSSRFVARFVSLLTSLR